MISMVGPDILGDAHEKSLCNQVHVFKVLYLFLEGFLGKQEVKPGCFLQYFEGSQELFLFVIGIC